MPPEFWIAIDQFNQGEYYACHDTLEALWMEALDPDRTFYQGILQIAVALYHLGNKNLRGATILLGEGMQRLQRYIPEYGEIDVASFVEQTRELLLILQEAQFDQPVPTSENLWAAYPVITQAGTYRTPVEGEP